MLRLFAAPRSTGPLTFRRFLESPDYCNLELSPVVAAIADASEGFPVVLDDELCEQTFGCFASALPNVARRVVAVRAGGRGGKTSRLVATKALHAAWTVDLPGLMPGEHANSTIIAPDLKLARQALSFVRGYIAASPILSKAVTRDTADSITLRRPDGKLCDITVGAATKGGKAARGRTLAFVALDEASFFYADDGHTVTDIEIERAAIGRIVPRGQLWEVSTPWIADVGVLEKRMGADWGTHELTLCAVGPTRALNPNWDADGTITADMLAEDAVNYEREILAVPLPADASTFFDPRAIARAFERESPSASVSGKGAGADFGFTADSSALAVAMRHDDGTFEVVEVIEHRPERGQPLKPSTTVAAFATIARRHGIDWLVADGHYKEAVREHLDDAGLRLIEAPEGSDGKSQTYLEVKRLLHEGRIKLPNNSRLKEQFRSIVAKPLQGGGLQISAPRKKGMGHGDLVSAVVLAVWRAAHANDGAMQKPRLVPTRWSGQGSRGFG